MGYLEKNNLLSSPYYNEAVEMVKKMVEVDYDLSQNEKSIDEFQRIVDQVRFLLKKNHAKMQSILYRVDIPEHAISMMVSEFGASKEAECITWLLISREIKKAETRAKYSGSKGLSKDDELSL